MVRPARHTKGIDHTQWLDLVDVSGPFLSLPVLRRTWPSLETLDGLTRERLRLEQAALPGPGWISYVLTGLLGWEELVHFTGSDDLAMDVPTYDTVVVPTFALREPGGEVDRDAKSIRLLGLICDVHPCHRIKDSDWPATPVDRLAQLCRHHDVQLGLATDGRWWVLVWAPRGSVTTTAVFDSVSWHETGERDVVRAFVSILGRTRFFGVADEETLPALLRESIESQEEITEALGLQVRQAVELVVAAIGRAHTADIARGGSGIGNVPAHDVYRGAVAVMMRIVFLLFAEERGFLPVGKELYRTAYSAGRLCAELEQRVRDGSEEDLEHTHAGWSRLLALFNAVYYGVDHPDMPMQGHDGSIFDADRYQWLPNTVDDRTVLHMLQAVQYVQVGSGKSRERRRLSFHALDVEEIGYVYEGLLSYEGFYANETFLGLVGRSGHEEEVPLRTLEYHAANCGDVSTLAARLADEYKTSGLGSTRALEVLLKPLTAAEEQQARRRLLAVTWGDYPLAERILPFFNIIRRDLRDLPVVILPDTLYVTESPLRKDTGTHYTPRFLAERVATEALEPLVYSPGPLQTADRKQWALKSSEEILSLKIADIAVGSAAFLVAACRYLANQVVTAWIQEGDERARDYDTESGNLTLDADIDPVIIDARRQVIEHCLYGADINEMAIEMAKLSLWLVSMAPEKPFTFLDDRLIVGDSLLGITSLDQLEVMHMDPGRGRELHEGEDALFGLTASVREVVRRVARGRREVVGISGGSLDGLAVKRARLAGLDRDTERIRLLADLTTGATLVHAGEGPDGLDSGSKRALSSVLTAVSGGEAAGSSLRRDADAWLYVDLPEGAFPRTPIHWPLAFPEVFERGGFDAIIGNPPYLGGQKLTGVLGRSYRENLVNVIGRGARGSADLCAYFLLRAHATLNARGQLGFIATNTISQGDTRDVGLNQVINDGSTIRCAIKSRPWPSKSAALEYSCVWMTMAKPNEQSACTVDGVTVVGISSSLVPLSRVNGPAYRLDVNRGKVFQGSNIVGIGFTLEATEADRLRQENARNSEVLYLYLNGKDLNSRYDSSASRWVINFGDWPEGRAAEYRECYERVLRLVKPARDRSNRKVYRDYWWQYGEKRPALIKAIGSLDRVIVIALVSKAVMPVMVPTGSVFSHMLGVFATDDTAMLALLSSSPHYWWTLSQASTLETRVRYTPSDVFETLALPEAMESMQATEAMRALGDRLDRERRNVMLTRQAGLTQTYNLVHDPNCKDADIAELRQIHDMIDEAVCRAYGWDDLVPDLEHGHHTVRRETRYTVGPAVQQEVVDRLLELNHERYAAEVALGLHGRTAKRAPGRRGASGIPGQPDGLF